jgi:hypothetical protein
MGNLIVTSDFNNVIASDVYTTDELDVAIETYETKLIYELLGVELAELFIDDLDIDGVPQTQRFIDIYEAWTKELNNELVSSIGIKQMLVKVVGFNFVRFQPQTNTIQGNTQAQGTINQPSAMSYTSLIVSYNEAIATYKAIQSFILVNIADYPEYKGVYKSFASWA